MATKKTLVMGIGNALLSDEGFGPAVIHYLKENYIFPENVNLVDGGTGGLMLMSDLMDCDFAIICDIALLGQTPGTIYLLEDFGASFSSRYSLHQTNLADILLNLEMIDCRPKTIILALEPFNYRDLSETITPEAEKLLPEFCDKIIEILNKNNIFPKQAGNK